MYKRTVLLITISFLVGCNSTESKISIATPGVIVASQTPPAQTPKPEKAKSSVNDDGWEIPNYKSEGILSTRSFVAKTVNGDEVKVISRRFGLRHPILSHDFFKSADRNSERMVKIWSVNELAVNNRVFCLELSAEPIDSKSNKPIPVNVVYRIRDLDGDGKFETLIVGKNESVPDWVAK